MSVVAGKKLGTTEQGQKVQCTADSSAPSKAELETEHNRAAAIRSRAEKVAVNAAEQETEQNQSRTEQLAPETQSLRSRARETGHSETEAAEQDRNRMQAAMVICTEKERWLNKAVPAMKAGFRFRVFSNN